jgi:chaperone modulatory protein CbpM
MEVQEFAQRSHLEPATLYSWIGAGWLIPVSSQSIFLFSEADLARAPLINDLKNDFGVNDEGVSIVLHLLDQLHGLRCLVHDIQAVKMSDRATDA